MSRPRPGEETSWSFAIGATIAESLLAWARLGGGLRYETWLAWDTDRWAPTAVKLARPGLVTCDRTVAGLAREATVAGGLSHPSVQRLYQARIDHPRPHLVMEYIEGPTLADIISADGPMSAGDVIRIGMQVAAALHYLHGRRLVHLDLKPANLILRDGRAIIIDLGFAETTGYQRPSSRPRGSPPYMAPEQCRCQPVAPAMDLFALGAVLYEVATGDPAFETAPDPGEDEYPQLRSQARPAHQSGVVKPLSAVIDALLERDWRRRPDTAAQALQLLEAALAAGDEPCWPAFVAPSGIVAPSGARPVAAASPAPSVPRQR